MNKNTSPYSPSQEADLPSADTYRTKNANSSGGIGMKAPNAFIGNLGEALREARLLGFKRTFLYAMRTLVQIVGDFPRIITVEASSWCNLDCPFCVTKELKVWEYREKEFFSFVEFKNLIDDTRHFCSRLIFSLYGEPLSNRELFKMIEYAEKKGILTTIFTNATLLTKNNIDNLLKSGATKVITSFESFEKDTYEATKRGAKLNVTQANIERLIKERNRRSLKKPQVILRVVVTKKTVGDLNTYIKKAEEMGPDAVSLKPLTVWPQGTDEYKERMFRDFVIDHPISRFREGENGDLTLRQRKRPCMSLCTPAVLSDGTVCLCWYDSVGETAIGNLNRDSFTSIWRKSARLRRKEMSHGNAFSLCQECPGIGADRHETIYYHK
jgi:radical SAM protein with 4Fe4S-binding SPASM domain